MKTRWSEWRLQNAILVYVKDILPLSFTLKWEEQFKKNFNCSQDTKQNISYDMSSHALTTVFMSFYVSYFMKHRFETVEKMTFIFGS